MDSHWCYKEVPRVSPASKHREGLIASSMALFQRQGYAATGLAEILSESGAPRGSLYHYFPEGKEAIADAALRNAGSIMEQRIRDATDRIGDPVEFVLAYGHRLAKVLSESGFQRGCQVATVALEVAPHSERLTLACDDVFTSWSKALADMLLKAGVAQDRTADLADFIISGFEGALILARVRRSTAPVLSAAVEIGRVVKNELHANGNV
jgi:TetR/AcrR family transcriptional repressor of lmrAB and yxaGH operons